jgi:serpin B
MNLNPEALTTSMLVLPQMEIRMRVIVRLVIVLVLVLLSGCGGLPADTGAIARSDLSRDAAPAVPPADAQALLDGNSAFAFDFYRQVRADSGNLVYSPFSISLAAAMLYGGAGGETASQMAGTFHFTLPSARLNPAWDALSLDLAQRPAQSKKVDSKNPMQLSIANAVWGQQGYPFEKAYLDLLAVDYGAGVHLADFTSAPDTARQQINDWVDRQTQGKIKDILPPGSLDHSTRMVLTNAIYFQAAWQEAFVAKLTHDAPFNLLNGMQVQVPTMRTEDEIPVETASGEDYQVVALPYKGDLAEMVIILPDQGSFETVESSLDAAAFAAMLQDLQPGNLVIYMPKFEFTAGFDLKPVLSAMGMPLAFDMSNADFSKIATIERLYVQQALHKAYILVDEAGTKAAAATIFGVAPASLPPRLLINRPFIFVIRDVPTGTILFVGRVLNPLEQ